MICHQNTPRKFFANLTADTICAPQRLRLMGPFGNAVLAKKLYPTADQEHGIRYQLK